MSTWLLLAATVAILALVAIAAVRLKPQVETDFTAPAAYSYSSARKREPAMAAEPAPGECAEPIGPTIAQAARPWAAGATTMTLPASSIGYPYMVTSGPRQDMAQFARLGPQGATGAANYGYYRGPQGSPGVTGSSWYSSPRADLEGRVAVIENELRRRQRGRG